MPLPRYTDGCVPCSADRADLGGGARQRVLRSHAGSAGEQDEPYPELSAPAGHFAGQHWKTAELARTANELHAIFDAAERGESADARLTRSLTAPARGSEPSRPVSGLPSSTFTACSQQLVRSRCSTGSPLAGHRQLEWRCSTLRRCVRRRLCGRSARFCAATCSNRHRVAQYRQRREEQTRGRQRCPGRLPSSAPPPARSVAPGREEAPAALRAAGLKDKLRQAGADTEDDGDVPGLSPGPGPVLPSGHDMLKLLPRWRVDGGRTSWPAANADGPAGSGSPGGVCAVGIGTDRGVRRGRDEPGPLYLDPHPDLNTPQRQHLRALLGSMGNAHLLGRPGAVWQPGSGWTTVQPRQPERLILLGASPTRSRPAEREVIDTLGIKVIAEANVAADPHNAAADESALIGNASYTLHFDSDWDPISVDTRPSAKTPTATSACHTKPPSRPSHAPPPYPDYKVITMTQITWDRGSADGSNDVHLHPRTG